MIYLGCTGPLRCCFGVFPRQHLALRLRVDSGLLALSSRQAKRCSPGEAPHPPLLRQSPSREAPSPTPSASPSRTRWKISRFARQADLRIRHFYYLTPHFAKTRFAIKSSSGGLSTGIRTIWLLLILAGVLDANRVLLGSSCTVPKISGQWHLAHSRRTNQNESWVQALAVYLYFR